MTGENVMTVFIRIGLALLFLDELVGGAWTVIWPEDRQAHRDALGKIGDVLGGGPLTP
jgi:hypothetical protein